MKKRLRFDILNSWESSAPIASTPVRLQRAHRSRLECSDRVQGPTGTYIPLYFPSLQKFKRFIRSRLRKGSAPLIAALRARGSIYIKRPGGIGHDQLTADLVIKDFCPALDTSHHHSE